MRNPLAYTALFAVFALLSIASIGQNYDQSASELQAETTVEAAVQPQYSPQAETVIKTTAASPHSPAAAKTAALVPASIVGGWTCLIFNWGCESDDSNEGGRGR